ncbi:MAG: PAAR domain-containing protein [Enterobacteriaceae bacterium]|jgi:uncharacterized Zn-binding protein involved in type VI secretion|nr:PAAR domain-containing protein [Enterobacteriaceae bacterium]
MLKACIATGDTTTHGGTLNEGVLNFSVMGKYAVTVGHKFWCPKCRCWSTFIEGCNNFSIDGKARVLQGHRASCGATAIHTQNHNEWCEDNRESAESVAIRKRRELEDKILANRETGNYSHQFIINNPTEEYVRYTVLSDTGEIQTGTISASNLSSAKVQTANSKKVHLAITAPKPKV